MPEESSGQICPEHPICLRFECKFKPDSVKLISIDLFEPNTANNDDPWIRIDSSLINDEVEKEAKRILKKNAADGAFDTGCDEGCVCEPGKIWSDWSHWSEVDIKGGFSIPAPLNGELKYRANGKVMVKSRVSPGTCYKVEL
jgi:hypothetical protein